MLLWTYEEAGTFSSELGGLRLMVAHATELSIYRYQVFKPMSDRAIYVSIASGHRPTLQDAFDAAEDAAGQLTTTH